MPHISDNISATLLANQSTVVVTHGYTFGDTAYGIAPRIPYQTSWWITNISATQFTLNVGTTNGYDQTIIFIIEGDV